MSKETTKKEPMSVVKKMMIALVGGLVVGIGFLLLRQHLTTSGNEAAWTVINKLLFQDITVEEGVGAVGIFYIVGQVFMRGLQLAIVPLVLVSLSLAMCSISNSTKLGRIAGLCMRRISWMRGSVCGKVSWIFRCHAAKRGSYGSIHDRCI